MIVSTYSIAACDLDASQWGVAVQSKFLAVGSVVPWAEPGVGAVATQAYANPRYGPDGLALLREGLSAEEVVQRLTDADDGRNERQLGVVDAHGNGASYTGSECMDWAGGRTGACYAAQGNILVGAGDGRRARSHVRGDGGPEPRGPPDRVPRRRAARGRRPPRAAVGVAPDRRAGRRLRAALRPRARSARRRPPAADRGAAAHPHDALPALRRRPRAKSGCRSRATSAPRWTSGSRALGYDTLDAWAGVENLEERVDGSDAIDPVVLDALREASPELGALRRPRGPRRRAVPRRRPAALGLPPAFVRAGRPGLCASRHFRARRPEPCSTRTLQLAPGEWRGRRDLERSRARRVLEAIVSQSPTASSQRTRSVTRRLRPAAGE